MLKLKSSKEFCTDIENTVSDMRMSYIESITHLCEENNLEIENVTPLLSSFIKEKIKYEAEGLNLVRKSTEKLPL
jgi:hypothetical protein|tara:strand:+ start:3489 stop:3713 length:225 start_codon:yes stop_codon:yes gene_type:complete